MIKAAFFDIDGTLVSLKKKVYPPSVKTALEQLHKNGILCFVASGRSKFEIRTEHLLDGLHFDAFLTNNGQTTYSADGRLLYGKRIAPAEADAVLDWVEKTNCACWMVTAEQSIMNHSNERVADTMTAIHTRLPEFGDLRALIREPIYKIVLFSTREEMQEVMTLCPTSRTTEWYPTGHDIISADGGKRNAMLELLLQYEISPEDCIAFGDSENDIEMLQTAGIGVAMANGTKECIAAADYLAPDCDDDGILKALEHFHLI